MESSQRYQRHDSSETNECIEKARQESIGSSFADPGVADLSERSSVAIPELGYGPKPSVSERVVSEPAITNLEPRSPLLLCRFRRFCRAFRSPQVHSSPPTNAAPILNVNPERFWSDRAYISDDEGYPQAGYGCVPRAELLHERLGDYIKDLRQCGNDYLGARIEKLIDMKYLSMGLRFKRFKARTSLHDEDMGVEAS